MTKDVSEVVRSQRGKANVEVEDGSAITLDFGEA